MYDGVLRKRIIYKDLRLWKCGYGEVENISWKDHVSNETVLQRVGEKWHLTKTIREGQALWIGHVSHRDTLVKDVIQGRMKGKKQIERP